MHLNAALTIIEPVASDSQKASLIEAKEYIENSEWLLAWDAIHDVVVNSGGEPDEIVTTKEWWYHLAQSARLML